MTPSPILALLMALGMILGGNALEGGSIWGIIQPTAFIIVIGGCVGATWLSATDAEIRDLARLMPRLVFPRSTDRRALLDLMVKIGNVVRHDGILAVEQMLPQIEDPFLVRGLQSLVDGYAIADVERLLLLELDTDEHHGTNAAKVLDTAGGFAPTIGILGAVLGLIQVMQNLAEPEKLGEGIAVAFVATIYGVGFANILFLPVGSRLKKIVANDAESRMMVITGLQVIASGANPRQVHDTLSVYVGGHGAEPAKEAA